MAQRVSTGKIIAAAVALGAVLLIGRVLKRAADSMQQSDTTPASNAVALRGTRLNADDLEITGLRPNQALYLGYSDFARLPVVTRRIEGDPNFPGQTLQVTGVYLDQLAKVLDAPKSSDLIDAMCSDHYRSHYPAEYVTEHHPLLVYRVDGLTPAAWAAKTKQDDPGPYFITYEHFVPAFRVLSHEDEAQVPTNVVRLNFGTEAATFGSIAPPAVDAKDAQVEQGFTIAKQNCLRCHFMGEYGGTKSGKDWMALSTQAEDEPGAFARYIRDPKSVDPRAKMPGNPDYDEATTTALTAYFRTFGERSQRVAGLDAR